MVVVESVAAESSIETESNGSIVEDVEERRGEAGVEAEVGSLVVWRLLALVAVEVRLIGMIRRDGVGSTVEARHS